MEIQDMYHPTEYTNRISHVLVSGRVTWKRYETFSKQFVYIPLSDFYIYPY